MIDFSFERDPFEVTPDPRMVFRHSQFTDAMEALERGLYGGKGFLVFTGEVGAGKTTLLRTFLASPHPHLETAVILNSGLSADELLLAIVEDLGLKCGAGYSRKALLDLLQGHLLEAFAEGRRTAVFIDEAQHLDFEALELVRMISNLETDTDKLIQIVLFGQDPLRESLASPDLFQLRSRVAVHRHLRPLTEADTAAYVLHRLAAARPKAPVTFSPAGLRRLHSLARGLPRLVNILADGALRIAASADAMIVDEHHVDAASAEFDDLAPESGPRPVPPEALSTRREPEVVREIREHRPVTPAVTQTPPPATLSSPEPRTTWPATTVFAWILLLAVLVVFMVRTWQANRAAPSRAVADTSATEVSPAITPLATEDPFPALDTPVEEPSAWNPAVVAAFFAASGLKTAYEPRPEDLRDPSAFALTLGRTLAEVPADSAVLRALGLAALVRDENAPEASFLLRPSPGHEDRVERHDAAGLRTMTWDELSLAPGGSALVAVPQGIDVTPDPTPSGVRRLQQALFDAGHYAGTVQGTLDPATIEALVDFQRVQRLPTTGSADAATILALVRLGVWKP